MSKMPCRMLGARHTYQRRRYPADLCRSSLLSDPHLFPQRQSMNSDIRILPPVEDDSGPSFLGGLYSMFTGGLDGMLNSVANRNPKFPPLEVLPCANVNVERYAVCENPGKLACSSCKLVSYCSKVCHFVRALLDADFSVRRNVKRLIGQPISQVSINLPAG